MHTNYRIIQHLFWNIAPKHGCVFKENTFSFRKKFGFSDKSKAHMLALVGDKVGAETLQMKPVNGIAMPLDLRRDYKGGERG